MIDVRILVILASDRTAAGPQDAILMEGGLLEGGLLEGRLMGGGGAAGQAATAMFQPSPAQAGSLHGTGCPCCATRSEAGRALAKLLQDRARGRVAFFHRVIAVARTAAGRADLEAALRTDPVAASCFRLA